MSGPVGTFLNNGTVNLCWSITLFEPEASALQGQRSLPPALLVPLSYGPGDFYFCIIFIWIFCMNIKMNKLFDCFMLHCFYFQRLILNNLANNQN